MVHAILLASLCLPHASAAAANCSRDVLNGTNRYAGWGAALDCLDTKMGTPFVKVRRPIYAEDKVLFMCMAS